MKKTLEQKQAAMRAKHDRRAKRGRPSQLEVIDDLGVARQHLVAFALLKRGHDTQLVARTINALFDRDITADAVARWIESGMPLQRLRDKADR